MKKINTTIYVAPNSIVFVHPSGKKKLVPLKKDKALFILTFFQMGWIKLFSDNRYLQGSINLGIAFFFAVIMKLLFDYIDDYMLVYTLNLKFFPFSFLLLQYIHGFVLSFKPELRVSELVKAGYGVENVEDQELVQGLTGKTVEILTKSY